MLLSHWSKQLTERGDSIQREPPNDVNTKRVTMVLFANKQKIFHLFFKLIKTHFSYTREEFLDRYGGLHFKLNNKEAGLENRQESMRILKFGRKMI